MSENDQAKALDHTAGASLLGYLYQVEVALLELIRRSRGRVADPGLAVTIEVLDDVAFDVAGSPEDVLQTKHTNAASLTDASTDLWRTIRVWIDLVTSGKVDPATTVLSLMTTSTAPPASAASFLRADDTRDPAAADRALERTAVGFGNTSNEKAYSAFLHLDVAERRNILRAVVILDGAADIVEVRNELTTLLWHVTHKSFHDLFLKYLTGWWYTRVVRHLVTPGDRILADEVDLAISDLREQFISDNLPIDPAIESMSMEDLESSDKVFVRQLQLIAAESPAIAQALRDYKRAFYQRSEWTKQQLLDANELERYERNLIEAWSFRQTLLDTSDVTAAGHQQAGLALYKDVLSQDIFIRERCRAPWVMRGSYHMLADDLRVGWHPQFLDSLRHLLPAA